MSNRLLKIIFIGASILLFLSGCRTNKTAGPIQKAMDLNFQFPLDWIGHYEGPLSVIDIHGDTQRVEMKLTIGPPDDLGMYTWTIQYGDKDKRYYGLEAINAEKGHYRIDEYNSIKLDAFLKGNNLITNFSILSRNITYSYRKEADGIAITVFFSKTEPVSITGKAIIKQDTIPEAKSHQVTAYQSGFLKQISPSEL